MRKLEEFLRDYVGAVGGVWDEVEPEVYDVLLPAEVANDLHSHRLDPSNRNSLDAHEETLIRLVFDPEAIEEHPQAQLLTFGHPFLERFLRQAHRRCQVGQAYLTGFYLLPHDIGRHIQRWLTLSPEVSIKIEGDQSRPLYFSNAVFWFQATFISDEKEQEIFPIAVDLHSGRQIRHLENLLAPQPPLTLVASRPFPFPDAPRLSLDKGYRLAWNQLEGTVEAIANQRKREIEARVSHQMGRISRYFQDMRQELHERLERLEKAKQKELKEVKEARKTKKAKEAKETEESAALRVERVEVLKGRLDAINREERIRLAELQQKASLRAELRLINLLWVKQPKLQVPIWLQSKTKKDQSAKTQLIWDPLTEKVEALDCPSCQHPSLALGIHRSGCVACLKCCS